MNDRELADELKHIYATQDDNQSVTGDWLAVLKRAKELLFKNAIYCVILTNDYSYYTDSKEEAEAFMNNHTDRATVSAVIYGAPLNVEKEQITRYTIKEK